MYVHIHIYTCTTSYYPMRHWTAGLQLSLRPRHDWQKTMGRIGNLRAAGGKCCQPPPHPPARLKMLNVTRQGMCSRTFNRSTDTMKPPQQGQRRDGRARAVSTSASQQTRASARLSGGGRGPRTSSGLRFWIELLGLGIVSLELRFPGTRRRRRSMACSVQSASGWRKRLPVDAVGGRPPHRSISALAFPTRRRGLALCQILDQKQQNCSILFRFRTQATNKRASAASSSSVGFKIFPIAHQWQREVWDSVCSTVLRVQIQPKTDMMAHGVVGGRRQN